MDWIWVSVFIVGYAIGSAMTSDKSYKAGYERGFKAGKDEARTTEEPHVTMTTADGRKHKIKVEV